MSVDPSATGPNDSSPASPTEAPPAPAESVPVDMPAESLTGESESAASQKPRIKIGTQRPGAVVPRVEPRAKVVFQTEPAVESSAAPAPASTSDSFSPSTSSAEPTAQPPLTPPIQRKPGGRKPKFESLAPRTGRVEKPNLRAPLPPELEAELQDALGTQSIDEMIAAEKADTAAAEALEPESRHKAAVVRIFRDDVFVELPGHNQGALVLHSFVREPQIGDVLDVIVTKFNAEEGLYELTAPGASVDIGDWSDIAEGITVDARITGHNKGGLECEVNKIRGFIPIGQVSLYRVENLEEFVGQSWPCIVVEANRERRNLVLSRRAILEREQAETKQKLLAELEVGQTREGVVRNIRDFGAFVDLGGIDGMIHVSQMSWDRVKHPSEVLQVGQKVKVKIQKIDPETHKISLAYRDLFDNPWTNVTAKYPVTSKVTGTVSKLMDFGAFVKLEPGVEGLVHISELSFKRVHRVSDIVQEGQQVEAKVLSVDPENQRISLSMKALEARPEPKKPESESEPEPAAEETPPAKKKPRKVPLQGGLGRSPLAKKYGLNW